jgi:CubicO group peptidase (beta-lactamase class C family)
MSQGTVGRLLDPDRLADRFDRLLEKHRLATAGAALIQQGQIAWTGYFGEQAPGVPATRDTLFNVASVAKTVTAELVVRLAHDGTVSLDEPMFPHWIVPDVMDDPRHRLLTPRLALTHRTGFPNWRYLDPQFTLRFVRDPGTQFGYSGEGIEYVARFVQEKTGQPFDLLVRKRVFGAMALRSMSMSPKPWVMERVVQPVDTEGARHRPLCTGPDERRCTRTGVWAAADDLVTSVEDYATFMIAVMNGDGVSDALQQDRLTVQSSTADDAVLACPLQDAEQCPVAQGYGLGWELFDFGYARIASHGGSDWSERAMVYFDVDTRDGLVLFLNGPSDTIVDALIEGMNILDPGSRIAMLYRGWTDAYRARMEAENRVPPEWRCQGRTA